MKLKVGDTISCRIRESAIVNSYTDYDEIRTFVIIAEDDDGWFLHVPHYYCLKDCLTVDQYRCRKMKIEKRFLDEEMVYIQESMIASIERRQDGINCCKCNEFYFYAVANQEDGTLICYECRRSPYH